MADSENTLELCPHMDVCGGCIYQGVLYEEQLALKNAEVEKLFEDKKLNPEEILGFEGSPTITGYRNKMEYTFGNMEKGGEMQLGMHKRGNYLSVVTVDKCMLVDPDFNIILRSVLEFCRSKEYTFYHKKSHIGLMRNLVIRKGQRTNELLVNIVTTSGDKLIPDGFDDDGFKDMLLGLNLKNTIVGILHTINDNISDTVKNEQMHVIYGRDYYMEKIMGLDFKVSAFSFFQTNVEAVERLYREALNMLGDVGGKTVFDLYCGTGTITQAMAVEAKAAVGVEIVEDAVEAARKNAELNKLENCRFIAGDVLKVLETIPEQPDVIIVDPPRAGMNYKILPKLLRYGVDEILYISCNPKTMTDNLAFMQENGYKISKMKAYDNFAFTKHTECVTLLMRATK